ncbi:hypothetical protein EJD97_003107 [Solanum chilense]|uniref:Uncharacterized protein n=1 Tax=Solanum chilense TaxID=4083 RepID=A0A6N2BYT5_SOLCI|nr:hypothetical protein EJD97_003107 [Solanum chilense]
MDRFAKAKIRCGGLWRRILPVKITFATTAASKTYVYLPMENVTSLIQKFATKTVQIQTIESTNGKNIPTDEAIFENKMTVSELMHSD